MNKPNRLNNRRRFRGSVRCWQLRCGDVKHDSSIERSSEMQTRNSVRQQHTVFTSTNLREITTKITKWSTTGCQQQCNYELMRAKFRDGPGLLSVGPVLAERPEANTTAADPGLACCRDVERADVELNNAYGPGVGRDRNCFK